MNPRIAVTIKLPFKGAACQREILASLAGAVFTACGIPLLAVFFAALRLETIFLAAFLAMIITPFDDVWRILPPHLSKIKKALLVFKDCDYL